MFPLNTVLFPYAQLQLHVFETRYREMVRSCVEKDQPFGIVLIRQGSEVGGSADPYMVGTAVRVIQVHNYEDGRMDIHVHGERRFRIRRIDDSHPHLVGYVEPIVEMEIDDSPETSSLLEQARHSFEEFIHNVFARQEFSVQVVLPNDPVVLSFTIANLLPMENLTKQRLLETTDTLERVQELIPILQTQNMEPPPPRFYPIGMEELKEWITPN